MIAHCDGLIVPCVVDNLAHQLLRTQVRIQRYAGNLCRWHDDSVERRHIVDEFHEHGSDVLDDLVADYQLSRLNRDARIARAKHIRKARK